jgi:hypothetical protein
MEGVQSVKKGKDKRGNKEIRGSKYITYICMKMA